MHDASLCKKISNPSPPQKKPLDQSLGQSLDQTLCQHLGTESVAAIAELELHCFTLPWTEEQFCRAFEQTAFAVTGISENGELVAYLSVYHTSDELEILNIAVRSDKRRRGFGRLLLGTALHEARKNGIVKAVLEVRPSNTPARGLYEGLGFVQAGLRKRYYPDTGEDALVYVFEMAE